MCEPGVAAVLASFLLLAPTVEAAEPPLALDTREGPLTSGVWDEDPGKAVIEEAAHLRIHRIREAWQYGLGSGIRVAWLDRGFHPDLPNHRELRRALRTDLAKGFAKDGQATSPWTPNPNGAPYHATFAALAGFADINNGAGGHGVAPDVQLIPIYVEGSVKDIVAGIRYALSVKADVIGINIDLNQPINPKTGKYDKQNWDYARLQLLIDAIKAARDANVPVVVAAGNDTLDVDNNFFAQTAAIIVGNALGNWDAYSTSNYGKRVNVWAHGFVATDDVVDNVKAPRDVMKGNGGTSYAAPITCGAIALLEGVARRAHITLTVADIQGLFARAATPILRGGEPVGNGFRLDAEYLIRTMLLDNKKYLDGYKIQSFRGLMANVRPNGKSEVADFVRSGLYIPNGLTPNVAVGTYSREVNDPYTYVRVEGWPIPDTNNLDVYRVVREPVPPPQIDSIAPTALQPNTAVTFTVKGQYLLAPLRLELVAGSTRLNVPRTNGNNAQSLGEFQLGGVPAGTYTAVLTAANGSANAGTIKVASNDRWTLRLYNVDDRAEVRINNHGVVLRATYNQNVEADVTGYFELGIPNAVELSTFNDSGGYTWGFELKKNGNLVFRREEGKVGVRGARNNDQSRGRVFYERIPVQFP